MLYQNSITAVITTFNSAKYIDKSIESVLKQTINIKKLIVVDDFSQDFRELEIQINKIKVKNKSIDIDIIKNYQNKGPGFSRNIAWSKVDTEYIAFLDSDDIWKLDKIENQLKIFNLKKNISLVASAKDRKIKNFKTGFANIDKMIFRNLVPLSSVLIKSKISHRFEEKYYAEDYELWLNFLFDNLNIYIINEVLCFENKNVIKKNLSNNYLAMTIETQKTLSKFLFKKKKYFFYILIAKFFEIIKFFIRVKRYKKLKIK